MSDPVRIVVGSGESAEVEVPSYGIIAGRDGEDGQNGVTFTPSVSDAGIISWTNDGDLPNPSPVNIKGSDGEDGEDGEDGVSPAVSFTTITGGHTMTVTDKDHPSGQSINIMDGEDGSAGTDGTTFTPAVDASGNLSWTNDGGKQNPPTVNIKGPQGEDAPDDYILVQTTQPTSETNAIWVDPSDETEVVLATWADVIGLYPTNTASGDVAHFEDGANNIPIKRLTVNVEPIQDLHGYDSPWPAGGGKNKLPPRTIAELQALNTSGTWSGNTYTHNGVSFACSVEDGYVNTLTLSGTATAFARFDFYRREDFAQFSGMIMNWYTQYISGVSITIQGSDSPWTTYVASPGTDRTIDTIDNSTCNLFVSVQANTVISSPLPMKPMIRLSSVADSTFAPYSNLCPISGRTSVTINHSGADTSDPEQTTIQLGDTVYGGTLDVLTGVLTVDRAEVDLGTLTWSKYTIAQGTMFRASISDSVSVSSTVAANAICSAYPVVAQTSRAEKTLSANFKKYDIINSDYSTAADFKTAMSGVQLVYELATPIEITLTPTQIDTLLGTNNIWSDAGSVDVEYRADIGLFIQQKIAELNGG